MPLIPWRSLYSTLELEGPFPQRIHPVHPVVLAKRIQVQPAVLPDGVAVDPAAPDRIVEAAAVVIQPRLGVLELGAEAVAEDVDPPPFGR